jgi:hypothetical protein
MNRCVGPGALCPSVEPHELAALAEVLAAVPMHSGCEGVATASAPCWRCVWWRCSAEPPTRPDLQVCHQRQRRGPRRAGLQRARANASTLGRMLAGIDGDTLDDAVGAWLARHATDPVRDENTLAGLAVDGKSVRGSRTDEATVHLPAAALHVAAAAAPPVLEADTACWTAPRRRARTPRSPAPGGVHGPGRTAVPTERLGVLAWRGC